MPCGRTVAAPAQAISRHLFAAEISLPKKLHRLRTPIQVSLPHRTPGLLVARVATSCDQPSRCQPGAQSAAGRRQRKPLFIRDGRSAPLIQAGSTKCRRSRTCNDQLQQYTNKAARSGMPLDQFTTSFSVLPGLRPAPDRRTTLPTSRRGPASRPRRGPSAAAAARQ